MDIQIRKSTPDEVPAIVRLMDIGMPLLDGLSVAQIIHDEKTNSLVPIIAVTAFSDIKAEAMKAGCADVLYKPVHPDELRKVLERYVA